MKKITNGPRVFTWGCLGFGVSLLVAATTVSTAAHQAVANDASDQGSAVELASPSGAPWLSKVSRTLRGGKRMTSAELREWSELPADEVLERLLNSSEFLATTFDFSMYFLGRRADSYSNPFVGGLSFDAQNSVPAKAATYEMQRDGDFLKILDGEFEGYTLAPSAPRRDPAFYGQFEDFDLDLLESLSDDELVAHLLERAHTETRKLREFYDTEGRDVFCDRFLQELVPFRAQHLQAMGMRGAAWLVLSQRGVQDMANLCFFDVYPMELFDQTMARIAEGPDLAVQFLERSRERGELLPWPVMGAPFGQLITYPAAEFAADVLAERDSASALTLPFWNVNGNSSTNMNRKRAAAVLKTYFCDDLIPLNVPAPSDDHGGDEHGSSPACQSCHYKLDPMAGFFREYGFFGFNFGADFNAVFDLGFRAQYGFANEVEQYLVFDDQATLVDEGLSEYKNQWRVDPSNPESAWNVGYIRSNTDSSLNNYGESLEDLFAIIKAAPESRRCLTKRLVDYLVGEGQLYDPEWIDQLAMEFDTEQNSSRAVKAIIKKVVKSQAFSQQDPDPSVCYDRINPDSPLPCEVSALLQRNCVQCHTGEDAQGGLALNTWIEVEGATGFRHVDEAGQQIAPAETFARIQDSLVSTDVNLRMPLSRHMSPREREELFLWIESQRELASGETEGEEK